VNVKNNVKKIFAVAAGIALVGVTLAGAMAYDLSSYPAPFVKDGMADGVIVVGANAATADVLGAIDIAASLQAEAVTGTPVDGSTVAASEGSDVIDTVDLNSQVTATDTQSDVDGLIDGTVRWDSENYDVYEELDVGETYVATYYPGSTYGEEEFGSDPYLTVDQAGNIMYKYVFDEAINGTGTTTFDDKNLEIKITRIGRGLPVGGDLEYADDITLSRAFEGRREV